MGDDDYMLPKVLEVSLFVQSVKIATRQVCFVRDWILRQQSTLKQFQYCHHLFIPSAGGLGRRYGAPWLTP